MDVSSPREIVVQWNSEQFGLLNVKMNLSPSDYIVALEAHKTGGQISINGLIERVNRTWILTLPESVQLLS
jgi:hypothetical protein